MNETLLEWLYAREMLRRLGFTPDEIFFVVYPSGRLVVDGAGPINMGAPIIALEVRRGSLVFKWTIGVMDVPAADIEPMFEQACDDWNAGRLDDHQAFLRSKVMAQSVDLLVALRSKGFVLTDMQLN